MTTIAGPLNITNLPTPHIRYTPTVSTAGRNEHDMTDTTTTPEEITPEQAEAELARLEQQVIDGGDVTLADLEAARTKITWAGLIRQRHEKRAADKRAKDTADAQQAAKDEATALLATSTASLESIHATASKALDKFLKQLAEHNELVESAGRILEAANVVHPDPGLVNPLDAPGLDPDFYVTSYGGTRSGVRVNGVTLTPAHVGGEFRKLAYAVADAHGLKTRGNSDLAYKIGRD
ncbi:hypothetical protein B7495_04755 [Cryobacterium sp. LW097]|uniref:hypothetical protein n=1 Tax=Cryobacterium sp. LW097 TaxID=1978566 RepID=UPI000B4C3773|nr:hypothetical protein [Cryobacterium sp. LW097]ASD21484.1 hypothetical protein B7495_04755 [Cryobacterium sp. LW097]